ncbi:accessory factor UbiK family protein [bacterium]|nr:accessory factor UbiK family protein [bacterium]
MPDNAPPSLDQIAQRLGQVLPPGLQAVRKELEDNFRAVLASQLDKAGMVSRDQFEAQKALLAASAERLAELEARIQALESAQRKAG